MTGQSSPTLENTKVLQDIYAALGHAIRFDIVQYLGTFHRPVQYTELVDWLQIKPGSFYFHVKKLRHLVKQDSEKKFVLTPLGEIALDIMKSGKEVHLKYQSRDVTAETDEVLPERFSIKLFGEFVRKKTFDRNFKFIIALMVVGQILIIDLARLGTIPFFFDGGLYFGLFGSILEIILSIIVIWILLEILMRYFSPIKGFSYELLTGIPIALSPLFVYPILVFLSEHIFVLAFLPDIIANAQISIILLFFLQIFSAVFLVQLLQVIKSVSFERALIPVFVVLYGFSILSFFVSSLF
ncbi:MAG: winged helix-turn-helix domain-containing protein [Candidatus Hodarchaeales archaeon]